VLQWSGDELDFVEISPVERTEFVGYDRLESDARVGLVRVFVEADAAMADVVTDRTPFYAESGGQVGDTGTVRLGAKSLEIVDTFRRGDLTAHRVKWGPASGSEAEAVESFFRSNTRCHLAVDEERRQSTARNHTATHLLHAALRNVLGKHVAQAGSLVEPERLRFDFQHHQGMTDAEIQSVEDEVNCAVLADIPVTKEIVPYKEAVAAGAMALFGEKYSDQVRVVTVEGVSKELCGGTHLDRTGEIGAFFIRQESAVGAGIRRIEALTGKGALRHVKRAFEERSEIARMLKVAPEDVERRVKSIVEENERLKKKLVDQEARLAGGRVGEVLESAEDVNGITLVSLTLGDGDVASLRRWGDRIREKLGVGVGLVCLAVEKPMLLIVASDRAMSERNIRANDLAAKIGRELSLRGGGKPHMAQMGLAKAQDFDRARSFVRGLLEDLG
jgi:alanyl-tRNA synthetase